MPRRNKSESMMCRTQSCDKPHEFLQFEGRYYCLECFDELTQQPAEDQATLVEAIEEMAD